MEIEKLKQYLESAVQARAENRHEQALAWYTQALAETAGSLNGKEPEIKRLRLDALREQAGLLHAMGRPQEALANYEQFYLEAGSNQQAVEALVMLGTHYSRMKQDGRALEALREALQLSEALNDTAGRARALRGIGTSLENLGRLEEALTYLSRALALFQQLNDREQQMYTWNVLGITHSRLGAMDKAIVAFRESLAVARTVGKQETTVRLNNLGECHQYLFDMEQALRYHREGLALAEEVGLPLRMADLSRNLGVELCYLGRVEEGLNYLHRALTISREFNHHDVELQSLYSLALVELDYGQPQNGGDFAQKLYELAQSAGAKGYIAQAQHASGLYQMKQGSKILAQQMWQEAMFLAHETNQRMLLWQLHEAMAGAAASPELAAVHYRIAAEIIEQIAYPIEDEGLKETFLNAPRVRTIRRVAAA